MNTNDYVQTGIRIHEKTGDPYAIGELASEGIVRCIGPLRLIDIEGDNVYQLRDYARRVLNESHGQQEYIKWARGEKWSADLKRHPLNGSPQYIGSAAKTEPIVHRQTPAEKEKGFKESQWKWPAILGIACLVGVFAVCGMLLSGFNPDAKSSYISRSELSEMFSDRECDAINDNTTTMRRHYAKSMVLSDAVDKALDDTQALIVREMGVDWNTAGRIIGICGTRR